MRIRRLLKVAMFLAMIVVAQMALVALPNIQITTMLFVLFFTFNKRMDSIILIISYSIMMGIFWGYTIWLIPMTVSWLIALAIFEVRKSKNEYNLAARGILMAMVLGLTYGLFSWVVLGWTGAMFISYMLIDIPFEIIMALSNFLSILLIYPRMYDILILLGEKSRV